MTLKPYLCVAQRAATTTSKRPRRWIVSSALGVLVGRLGARIFVARQSPQKKV